MQKTRKCEWHFHCPARQCASHNLQGGKAPDTDTERALPSFYASSVRAMLEKLSHPGVIHQKIRDPKDTLVSIKYSVCCHC